MAISVVSFLFSRAAQPEAQGPSFLLSVGFLYHIFSKFWFSKTNWLPVLTELYNSSIYLWNDMFDSHQGNNCHAVHRLLSSRASVYDCTAGFYLVSFNQPSSPTPIYTSAVFGMACLVGSKVNIQHRSHFPICEQQAADISTLWQTYTICWPIYIPRYQYRIYGKNVNMHLAKAWNAINRLLITLKTDRTDKIKWDFFQVMVFSILLHGCIIANEMHGEEASWKILKNDILNKSLKHHLIKEQLRPPTFHLTSSWCNG